MPMHPNIKKWEQDAEERTKTKLEEDNKLRERYTAPKIGDVHTSVVDAKHAINAALESAKNKSDELAAGICTGLLYLCDAIYTVARDTEITRNRVEALVNSLPPNRRRP